MSATQAYNSLLNHLRETSTLEATSRLLVWDMETQMPTGGAGSGAPPAVEYRGRQLAQMAALLHARKTDPRVGEWLAACEPDPNLTGDPHSDPATNLREARRDYDHAIKLPASLVEEWSRATTRSRHAWADARKKSDFNLFRPHLERVVELARQKAACWGAPSPNVIPAKAGTQSQEPWDALADVMEPGLKAAEIAALFTPLAKELAHLVESLPPPRDPLEGLRIPIDRQRGFCRHVAAQLGFDAARGVVAESTHPFCMGLHRDDVRITSRYREDLPLDSLSSTIHEAGHAIYNQNTPDGPALDTHAGQPLRFAIHESQSRMIENQVGRSRAFWSWCGPIARQHFAPACDHAGDGDLFRSVNVFRPSLIRTESDELTYNLHIVVRFELERAMIRGDLAVKELPAAWNEGYRKNLGVTVPDDARGCLQDVHWSEGLFG